MTAWGHYILLTSGIRIIRAVVRTYIGSTQGSTHKSSFIIVYETCFYSNIFKTKKFPSSDFILSNTLDLSAKFSGETGLLKSVTLGSSEVIVDVDFVSYGTRSGKDKSGAYLFLPDKEATSIVRSRKPKTIIIAGPLVRNLYVCVSVLLIIVYGCNNCVYSFKK